MTNNNETSKKIDKYLDSVYTLSHSQLSVNSYRNALNNFLKFIQINYNHSVDEVISKVLSGEIERYEMLNDFIIFADKLGKRPATIKLWVTAVKGLLRQFGIKIYSEDFRQLVRIPKDIKTREEPLTKEIMVRLLRNLPPKLQTVILIAIASAMRIGEIVQLRLSDIDFESHPTKILIRALTTKTRESRETFLTLEATNALKDYLSRFFGWKEGESNANLQDSIIFGRTTLSRSSIKNSAGFGTIRKQDNELLHTPEIVAKNVLIGSLKKYISKVPDLAKLSENGRMVIHFHAFRKFFYTTVSNEVGANYAHALMGHHEYLDTYYNLPEEKKKELYLKAEPHLTVSDFTKIEKDLMFVTEKQKEIEKNHLELLQMIKSERIDFPKVLEKYIK